MFGESTSRVLNGRVQVTTEEQIENGLATIGHYNGFNPAHVQEALLEHVLPLSELRHETKGIFLGREMSPVIYIPTTLKKLDVDFEEFIEACFQAGRDTNADEIIAEYKTNDWMGRDSEPSLPEQPREVRLWWD
jgi:hypothetical protein